MTNNGPEADQGLYSCSQDIFAHIPLLYECHELKDRQIHRDNDKADRAAEKDHQHRLHHRGEVGNGIVHFIVIKISDLAKAFVSSAPVDSPTAIMWVTMGGNTLDFNKGSASVLPSGHSKPYVHDRIFYNFVARRLCRYFEAVEYRDAAAYERA